MSLETKEVELTWYIKTKKHYVNKGYPFTNYGDKFIAKVEDLSNGCLAMVKVKCDYCGEVFSKTFHQHNSRRNNIIIKDCCDNCKGKKSAEAHAKIRKIKEDNSNNIFSKDSQQKYNYTYKSEYKIIDENDNLLLGVYRIINKINGKVYIGSAINLKTRKNNHINRLRKSNHHSIHLQRSWSKYGEGSFEFEVIEYIDNKENLIEREQFWIDYYKSYNDIYGYNMRPKAESPLGTTHKVSLETKNKISKANTGRIRNDMRVQNNNNCILSEEQVCNLKIDLSNGLHPKEISEKYNIKITYVYDIAYKRKFNYILPDLDINFERKLGGQKLNKENVKQIREMLINNVSIKELSKLFNITEATIRDIKNFKTWKNVV